MQLVTTNVSEKVHLEEYFHLDKPVVLKSGYKPQMNFFFLFLFVLTSCCLCAIALSTIVLL